MFPEGRIVDFMILGAVALIVVGPKDLPILMRKVGQFVARMRAMAAEFRASFDEIARQSELDELRREVAAMRATVALPTMTGVVMGPEAKQAYNDIKSGLAEAKPEDEQPSLPFGAPAEDKTAKADS
jgi:sec-independent protein translocase protein TatB